ncbi:membrane-bound O-acyltransferase family protein [Hanstruepera neustonica]|uniref:Membrane-bound O-acyltransferase family protein n=1 Tax=Hanstruepera neustonica TaxID=1445657 RepID=A0A2K1DVN9_9FLAO|nr:MBOAT family O-acyltransferase [Hanstruepera neustonica]PNQ72101.1 membrane-bound O-acyltransferase family protein [Hanstruepera neustonica]
MLFNSLDFAVFLPIVFVLYWFVFKTSLKLQNLLIVLASYVFYGWWDWRFLSLILFSSVLDYVIGIYISQTTLPSKRKALLFTSVFFNIGLLGFFKYYNFFVDSFVSSFSFFGWTIQPNTLNIILPVGISFYTFQTLSYSIDIYRNKLQPTRNFIGFAAFVSFFPQLVAGPIERATHLLPQFYNKRLFNYHKAVDGLRQILWGMFKKVVIADNCARYVNMIFDDYTSYSGSTLFLGVFLFAFQIYGDFSGYSDIAIGTARLFGFELKQNFAFPYFSRDVAEFWRRWHISLSTWFRDYVYIPLGGSQGSKLNQIRNVLIIFVVSGFWHGANWTFIVWGAINALYFLPLLLFERNRVHTDVVAAYRLLPSFKEVFKMGITFLLILLSWVFFRAESLSHALGYLWQMATDNFVSIPQMRPTYLFVLIFIFIIVEWLGRKQQYAIELLWLQYPKVMRWGFYFCIAILIFLYGGQEAAFIYFQF